MEYIDSDSSGERESDCYGTQNVVSDLYDEDYSDSEREWREAVKAAVETEIQYQVHLRLSLDELRNNYVHSDSEEEHAQQDLVQCDRLKRNRMRRRKKVVAATSSRQDVAVLDVGGARVEEENVPKQCKSFGVPSFSTGTAVSHRSIKTHTIAQPSEKSTTTNTEHLQPLAQLKEPQSQSHTQSKQPQSQQCTQSEQPQSLQEYLHSKYGVPLSHLQHWTKHGHFKCSLPRPLARGVDMHIRWPVEKEILHSTPQLTSVQISSQQVSLDVQSSCTPLSTSKTEVLPGRIVYSADKCDVVSFGKMETTGLKFESRFESGNLWKALQIGPYEYDLVLNADLYNERHTQWFYFKVTGMENGVTYSFNILNLQKKDSLYNHGMKLLFYTEVGGGWMRIGRDFNYQKLCYPYNPSLKPDMDYYCLSWKMEFPYAGDTCYFSHCYPYSFTQLLQLLQSVNADSRRSKYMKTEVLCETLAGNPCHLLTISDFEGTDERLRERPAVVFTARVHPGESNSSWMMQGVIEFLVSEHKHAKYLRSHYLFKLIPMLNPDGVIVGNYRTALSGVDLNRTYKNPHERMFPTVYHTKQLVYSLLEERKIAVYIDLHGHSRNHNVFMYGCHTPKCSHSHFLKERIIPWLLAQVAETKFSFKSCKFNVQRSKASTARVVMWKMGLSNSFTMEASFCGTTLTKPDPLHFTQDDLLAMGRELCHVLIKVHRYNNSSSYRHKIDSDLAEYLVQQFAPEEQQPVPEEALLSKGILCTSGGKKEKRHKMSKSLQKLYAMDIHQLEAESSTSGSDSDNDDFTFAKHKPKSKRHKQKKATSIVPGHAATKQAGHGQERGKHPSLSLVVPKEAELVSREKEAASKKQGHRRDPMKHTNSAPPRLEGAVQLHQPHGWRFVSKYTNRSGGGFPIFSEERMKERAEKQRLRSLSLIQETDTNKTKKSVEDSTKSLLLPHLPDGCSQHKPQSGLQSFLWEPMGSQRQHALLASSKRLLPDTSSEEKGGRSQLLYSSAMHHKRVIGRVESKRLLSGSGSMHGKFPRPARTLVRFQSPVAPPPLPTGMGLPPQLMKYITEVWKKHVNEII